MHGLIFRPGGVLTAIVRTANEGPVRIQYKCLVMIYVLPEMKLHVLVNSKQNYNVLSLNFHIHVQYLRAIYIQCISRISLPIFLQPNRQTDPGNI